MIKVLNKENTILNKFLAQMRDRVVQRDSMRFRRNMERVGEIMAYEISKRLHYKTEMVETPLGIAQLENIDDKVVIATILRAGLPFHQGFLNYFDDADNAFVSAYRKSRPDGSFIVDVEYVSTTSLAGKTLILVDPLLATGTSLMLVYDALIRRAESPTIPILRRCLHPKRVWTMSLSIPIPTSVRCGVRLWMRSLPRSHILSQALVMQATWLTA